MLIHKLKLVALVVVFLGSAATSAGYLNHSLAMKEEPKKAAAAQQSRPATRSDRPDSSLVPGPGRMFVTGRVLDPAGKPAAGVVVDIIGQPRVLSLSTREYVGRIVLVGGGETDAGGHFRIDALRTSGERFVEVYAVAAAPGFGRGWVQLNADARQPAAELRLRAEQVIRGKLFDVHGQPAAGVELQVWSVGRPTETGWYDGVSMGNPPPPEGMRAWPGPVATDNQGNFAVTGIGRNVTVGFHIRDRRFANGGLQVRTDDRDGPKTVTEALRPGMTVEGSVLAADTGQPIPHALVEVDLSSALGAAPHRADGQGRFTATVQPGKNYRVQALPPGDQPYLSATVEFEWTKGAVRKEIDVKVPRGVVIHGKVMEAGTGHASPEASVQFIPMGDRPDAIASGSDTTVASKADGAYTRLPSRPERGTCLCSALRPTISSRRLAVERSTMVSPAEHVIMPTTLSPMRSRPATRHRSSRPSCGRGRPSRAALSGQTTRLSIRRL